MYPGVWRHGDWIEITSRGTAVIYGRSDSTINRSGIRMGTSEIYRAVLGIDEIVDALVVDVPRPGTEGWMPLFVVLREGAELDDELREEIARRVREQLLAAPRPRRGLPDRRGAAHAQRQGARGAGEADPDGHARREGGQPRLARQPGGARLLRRDGRLRLVNAAARGAFAAMSGASASSGRPARGAIPQAPTSSASSGSGSAEVGDRVGQRAARVALVGDEPGQQGRVGALRRVDPVGDQGQQRSARRRRRSRPQRGFDAPCHRRNGSERR